MSNTDHTSERFPKEVAVYSAADSVEAHILRSKLLAAGIHCRIDNDGFDGVKGAVPFGPTTSPRIWVSHSDAAEAREMIERHQKPVANQPDSIETDAMESDGVGPSDHTDASLGRILRSPRELIVLAVICFVVVFTIWAIIHSERQNTAAEFAWEGYMAIKRGEFEEALLQCSKAIELTPSDATLFINRGYANQRLGRDEDAIQDYSLALEFGWDADHSEVLFSRGVCNEWTGRYANALRDFEQVLELNSGNLEARNAVAWLLAACPNDDVRNGKTALAHARRICDESAVTPWYFLDTLAAAHAECGEFEKAAEIQSLVIEMAPIYEKDRCGEALTKYRNQEPVRIESPQTTP